MQIEELRPSETMASPEAAVDRLADLHAGATQALRTALARFLDEGIVPDMGTRMQFRYPELRVTYAPEGPVPRIKRATAKLQSPGTYATTVTQADYFRPYLLDQLRPLVRDYGVAIEVGSSAQEIPYPYVVEPGADLARSGATPADLARHFPVPLLSAVGDEIADGLWEPETDGIRPLALFDAVRIDFSLRRLVHYTGSDWRNVQPWILLTNYHRYVDQFVRVGPPGPGAWRRRLQEAGHARRASWCSAARPSRPTLRPSSRRRLGTARKCPPTTSWGATPRGRPPARRWSTSGSAPPMPRTSPTISRCCARIAG